MTLEIGNFEFTDEQNDKIEQLRKLIEDCKVLKIGTEIEILGRYLYSTEWDVQKAYTLIHDYYDFKNKYPDWITTYQSPDDFLNVIDLNARILLPHKDKQGKFVFILKHVDAFDKIPNYVIKLAQVDDLIYESLLSSPHGQKYGITTILDTGGINKNYLKHVTPSIATIIGKKFDVVPVHPEDKKVNFILRSSIISALLSVVLPFLGNLKKMAMFHKSSNLEKLKEYIGEEYLPYEYGGPESNKFDSSYLKEFLQTRYSYVQKSQKYHKES